MNLDLAERAIKAARDNPEQFDMDDWVDGNYEGFTKDSEDFTPPCGTTACYAGWVSFLAAPVGSKVVGSFVYTPGNDPRRRVHVADYAREVLGLSDDQEQVLFYLENLNQVEKGVRYLAYYPHAGYEELREAARA